MNAIILFSYANIHSIDDIEPFYNHLFHGNVQENSLQRGQEMFKSLATCDPLASNTRRIGEALVRRLHDSTGEEWRYYIGNKHIYPFVNDAIRQCIKDDAQRIITMALTPLYSRTGTEVYEKQVVKSLNEQNHSDIPVVHITPFYNNDAMIDVLSSRLDDAIHWLSQDVRDKAEVIFTAHSMPGKPEAHQKFIDQYKTLAERLINRTKINQYHIAYRSGGPYPQRWLEPDILDAIQKVADKNGKAIIVCELLSMIANSEAIHELGHEGKTLAHQLGMEYVQTEYLNDSDDFITALQHHILKEI